MVPPQRNFGARKLTDASGEHLYHQLDGALEFMVYPGGDERGLVRLEGSWQKESS